ncbi:methyltransferase domain-containing protein [Variovorax saccharolyticus]|uniref:methyltransferase domain-containing protein n=1 Tax=Variovorax saccharolyticus TaxID=3053516 RepID=UPI0025772E9D|nr:methyltransferase domain-containing protein [Variovorax sp. J31P216]MDM0028699.1 methyltransferase domain-containing protein [Variovorax sp. J31P216]
MLALPPRRAQTRSVFPFAPQPDFEPSGLASIEDRLHGACPVCGVDSDFDRFTSNLRESGFCSSCGSFNRQRQMAHVLRTSSGLLAHGKLALANGTVVYNTETTGAMHQALCGSDNYLCSEYFGDQFESGQLVDGRRHEDLQQLSFADSSIDIVLSSDVLEHMPEPYKAHSEIFRVLRRGGRHIFTVPFNSHLPLDDVRAEIVDGSIRYRGEKLYHGDPVRPEEGILVWTIFGLEMFVRLARIGFELKAWNLYEPGEGIVGSHSLVFEARKPEIQPDT